MKTRLLALCSVLLSGTVITACAYFQGLDGHLPDIARILLADLEKSLTAYEEAALVEPESPEAALAILAIQTARRALIIALLGSLADQYPDIDTTDYHDRLASATANEPLLE